MLKRSMAKGKTSKAFRKAAKPWGDKLPDAQPPMFITGNYEIVGSEGMAEFRRRAEEQYAKILIERSKRAAPTLKKICQFLMSEANRDLAEVDHRDEGFSVKRSFKMGPPKSLERFLKKARDEKNGVLEHVNDPGRCEIKAKTPKQVAAMCSTMEWACLNDIELPGGARIIDFRNRFDIPTASRFRSGLAVVAIPVMDEDGNDSWVLNEIQLTNEGFANDITNPTVQRKLNAGAKTDLKLKELMTDSHSVYEWVRYIEERYQTDIKPEPVAILYEYYRDLVKKIHDDAAKRNGIYDGQIDFAPFYALREKRNVHALSIKNRELAYA